MRWPKRSSMGEASPRSLANQDGTLKTHLRRRLVGIGPVTFQVSPLPAGRLTHSGPSLTLSMKRQMFSWALLACIATGVLLFSGCSTVSSRINANQAGFAQLSPQDQALVREGK